MIRLFNTSLQMCRGREMEAYRIVIGISLEIMPKQYVETFFQRPAVLVFKVHSRFLGRISALAQTREKG